MNYSYKQLKAEKTSRQLEYYKEMENIEKGVKQANSALRQCRYNSARQSKRKLVHPCFKSGL